MKTMRSLFVVIFAAVSSFTSLAAPRDVLPPWPESTLGIWGFNYWHAPLLPGRTVVGIEAAQVAESWSGYSLVRDALTVSPVAIPVIEPANGTRNFTTDQGTIRFWFRPDWSSATRGGKGPGDYARLVEMVALGSKESQVVWSLYLNPEGTVIYLSGQGVGGAMDFLKAEVNWAAGSWHMLALAYDGEQTTLTIDRAQVASGPVLPPVATWQRDALALVLGSDLSGAGVVQGEFDELCTFDHAVPLKDLAFYWRGQRRWVALGPVGTAAEEAAKLATLSERVQMMTMESGSLEFPGEDDPPEEGEPIDWPEYTSPIYPSNALWLSIEGVSNGVAYVTLHGTVPDTLYELLSKEELTNAVWQPESPLWVGAEGQDWTPATVVVGLRTNHLFLWARSWADEDGNGMPDWWELEVLGGVGADPYADPDGDGWVNLQEYQNGTSPTNFNTPAAPQGVSVRLEQGGTNATVSWLPSPGNVTGYTVERQLGWGSELDTFTLSANTTTFVDDSGELPTGLYWLSDAPTYRVRAHYASGDSDNGNWTRALESLTPAASLLPGPLSSAVAVIGSVPTTATAVRAGTWQLQRDASWNYLYVSTAEWDLPLSSITNGLLALPGIPELWVDESGQAWNGGHYIQWVSSNGAASSVAASSYDHNLNPVSGQWWDAREHLRQNLIFQLRAATENEGFAYRRTGTGWGAIWGLGWHIPVQYPADMAVASYYVVDDYWAEPDAYVDAMRPLYENHELRNFGFGLDVLDDGGSLTTGAAWTFGAEPALDYPALYLFDPGTTTLPAPAILDASSTQWVLWSETFNLMNGGLEGLFGISYDSGSWHFPTGSRNVFGLPIESFMLAWGDSAGDTAVLSSGGSVAAPGAVGRYYLGTAAPQLELAGWYFGEQYRDWLPGHTAFSPTAPAPLLITGVGNPWFAVVGYAQYRLANGDTNKPAYLGQYFDKAYRANPDGSRSTNQTGVLSPYGEFVATEPGKAYLTTKPDGISTNAGECVVHAIKLQLDVNHDGVMDTSWAGPDNTTWEKPFTFWVNNDYDRAKFPGYPNFDPGSDKTLTLRYADQFFRDHLEFFPTSIRDLEDWTRLWICGIPLLTNGNMAVTLSWANTTGSPAVNVIRSAETNGGLLYLTDTNISSLTGTAWRQISTDFGSKYRVPANGSVTLPSQWFTNAADSYMLFEGAGIGKGELVLTVWIDSNIVAQSSAWLELKDVKDMIDHAHVANPPASPPFETLTDQSTFIVDSTAAESDGDGKQIVVFVHGWRVSQWVAENFAQTMFKRLWWQGYQGRYATLRWPTLSGETDGPIAQFLTFNRDEYIAFKCAKGAADYFTNLQSRFPEYTINVAAHSHGNVLMMEVLKRHLAAGQSPIHNFALLQAAVAAECLDTNAPQFFDFIYGLPPTPAAFYGYAETISNAVSGKLINFYNTNDFGVVTCWQPNQLLYKPDGRYFYQVLPNGPYQTPIGSSRLVTDPHELMAFVSRPQTQAVGGMADLGGSLSTADQVDLVTLVGFDRFWDEHSGEFNWPIQRLRPFYQMLGLKLDVLDQP